MWRAIDTYALYSMLREGFSISLNLCLDVGLPSLMPKVADEHHMRNYALSDYQIDAAR